MSVGSSTSLVCIINRVYSSSLVYTINKVYSASLLYTINGVYSISLVYIINEVYSSFLGLYNEQGFKNGFKNLKISSCRRHSPLRIMTVY